MCNKISWILSKNCKPVSLGLCLILVRLLFNEGRSLLSPKCCFNIGLMSVSQLFAFELQYKTVLARPVILLVIPCINSLLLMLFGSVAFQKVLSKSSQTEIKEAKFTGFPSNSGITL